MKVSKLVRDYPITLTSSFNIILAGFGIAFNSFTMATFVTLVTGAILVRGRHTVTRMIVAAGIRVKHHSCFHRFFSRACWCIDELWHILVVLVAANLIPEDAQVWVAVDDTAQKKTGGKIYGVGMVHDNRPASQKGWNLTWGLTWVVASVMVRLPLWLWHVFAIPIGVRLYHKKGFCRQTRRQFKTKIELAAEMIQTIASWLPGRRIRLHVDGAYASNKVMARLPDGVDVVGRLRWDAALYARPAKAKGRGRPRKKGRKLHNPGNYVAKRSNEWQTITLANGKRWQVQSWQALWPTVFGTRLLLIVAARRPADAGHPKPGEPEFFYATELSLTPAEVLGAYSRRWSIERLFHELKERMGFEHPQCRTEKAVERTAPFLVFVTGLVQYWFLTRPEPEKVGFRPRWRCKRGYQQAPPCFSDMLALLRTETFEDGILHRSTSKRDQHEITRAVIQSAAYAA